MGTTEKTRHGKRTQRGTFNRDSWFRFLDLYLRINEMDILVLNGFHISDTARRALYRWRAEGALPLWYSADAFLCQGDMNWNDFEDWCSQEGLPLWEKEAPEDWD